jgi:hypothetical protein
LLDVSDVTQAMFSLLQVKDWFVVLLFVFSGYFWFEKFIPTH